LDAIQRKCLACGEPFTGVSRRQKYCSQKCRPSDQNTFQGPLHWGAENQDLSCLQPIENVHAGLAHFQEFQTSLPHANFSKELHFEDWPQRTSKRAACVTYKITDGQQINTGYGRASRALGYVMEIWSGRWVARVSNLISLPFSLPAAKRTAIHLYRPRKNGEAKDWIEELNQAVANEIDRAYRTREKCKWPVDLMGAHRQSAKPQFTVDHKLRKTILDTERVLENHGLVGEALKGDDIPLEFHEDGYPRLPDCLDRRPKPLLAQAA
jgi:endogenous inhibitor of DNA gyrase (YacG/DUF329 family)